MNTDCLRRFLFENSRIRGFLVSIDETFRTAIERHAYPEPVRNLVGEALSATALRFECSCSRQTIEALLRASGREEAEAIVREEGGVHATCEFCNRRFDLDAVDVAAVFDANVGGTSMPQ